MKNYHYNPGWETKSWAFIFKGLAYELTKEGEKIRWASVKTCVDSDTEKFLNRHGVEKPEEEMVRLVMEIREYLLNSIPNNFILVIERDWLGSRTWQEVESVEYAKGVFNYLSVFIGEVMEPNTEMTIGEDENYKEGTIGKIIQYSDEKKLDLRVKVIRIIHRK